MKEQPCYATVLGNVVWKCKSHTEAHKNSILLATAHGGSGNARNHMLGLVSDWSLFRAHNPDIDVRNQP